LGLPKQSVEVDTPQQLVMRVVYVHPDVERYGSPDEQVRRAIASQPAKPIQRQPTSQPPPSTTKNPCRSNMVNPGGFAQAFWAMFTLV